MIKAENLYERLHRIEELLHQYVNPDGSYSFDMEQVAVALDLVIHLIEKDSIKPRSFHKQPETRQMV